MKRASVVHGPKHRQAGVLRFFPAGPFQRFFPDVFGNGGNALGVCGGVFSGCFSFLVLGLFHIVIVAGRDGTAGVLGWRLDGI